MPRKRAPAAVKKGNSESKAQLKKRQEIEASLKGNDDKIGEAPKYFSKEEKIYYDFLVEELKHLEGIISNIDAPLLHQVATILNILRLADEDIRKNGILIKTYDKFGNEKTVPNPSLKIKIDFNTKYLALCNQLPLSPSSRASLASKKLNDKENSPENDPVLRLLQGMA